MKTVFVKYIILLFSIQFITLFSYSQNKTYCAFDNYSSKYQLSLTESEGTLTYKKFSSSGNLIQTLYGTFEVQDEGVYGSAPKVVAKINGSIVKWLIIRNGYGEVQELRDESAGRLWSPCNSQANNSNQDNNNNLQDRTGSTRAGADVIIPSQIIGKVKKIGNLVIAQYDFKEQKSMAEALKACKSLGVGWRLPTKTELDLIYKNRAIIGGFKKGDYWSSLNSDYFIGDFSNGVQRKFIALIEGNAAKFNVRAVRKN